MARGGIDHEGIGKLGMTYKADAALASAVATAGGIGTTAGRAAVIGKAVTWSASPFEAGFGNAGDPLLGIVESYDHDDNMTVLTRGYAYAPGVSDSLPSPGDILVVDGSGAVMASTGAVGVARADAVLTTAATGPVMVFIG